MRKKSGGKPEVRKTEVGSAKQRRPFTGKCNYCNKIGHIGKECRTPKDKLQCESCNGKKPAPHNTGAYICPISKQRRSTRGGNKTRATGARAENDKKKESKEPSRWSDDDDISENETESCNVTKVRCVKNPPKETPLIKMEFSSPKA